VFTVTACFFPGLRGRQKDCSTNLILRTPMCTRPRQKPTKCEWKRGDQFNSEQRILMMQHKACWQHAADQWLSAICRASPV
jgi:hypothetical protein